MIEEQKRREAQIRAEEERRLQDEQMREEERKREEERRITQENQIRENERQLREQQKQIEDERMEQERQKLAMQLSIDKGGLEKEDDAAQWLILQQKQEELKKLLGREQQLKLLKERELAKLGMTEQVGLGNVDDHEKAFREWLRQQESENDSMINRQDKSSTGVHQPNVTLGNNVP